MKMRLYIEYANKDELWALWHPRRGYISVLDMSQIWRGISPFPSKNGSHGFLSQQFSIHRGRLLPAPPVLLVESPAPTANAETSANATTTTTAPATATARAPPAATAAATDIVARAKEEDETELQVGPQS